MLRNKLLGIIVLTFFSIICFADNAFVQRKDVQQFINLLVKEHNFSKWQLNSILKQVQLQPQIIESMEKPYEKKNWDVYKAIFLTPQRLKSGLDFWQANQAILDEASKRYGLPPEIIVAILGVETLYGEKQGNNKVLDALATLAFNYPKRAAYFKHELKEYLLLCKELHVSPTHLGSYAGAIGKPQFMPSSYRRFAIDYHDRGKPDLVNNDADTIASIANYFKKHGWRTDEGIVQHAQIHGTRYKRLMMNPRYANYPLSKLEAAGVKPVTASYHHPNKAGLIELVTSEGNEYWMAYPNFFVIMRYNASPQYALVVYLLSQQLKMQWAAIQSPNLRAFV